jgi:hypothetical protein
MDPPSPTSTPLPSRRAPWSVTGWFERAGLRDVFARPLVLTLFLWSFSVILDFYTPAFEWLDVAMLSIAPHFLLYEPKPAPKSDFLVVTLPSRFFEAEFGGQSPIPRAAFRQLLAKVVDTFQPEVLAVDYDLSPSCGDLSKEEGTDLDCGELIARDVRGRQMLDQYLISPAKPWLILVRPTPAVNPGLADARSRWAETLQSSGRVIFADADLLHHNILDTVVKYEPKPVSLALLALCGVRAWALSCENNRGEGAATTSKPRPLNFLGAAATIPLCPLKGLESLNQCGTIFGHFHAVFIGADYDEADIFNTVLGKTPGVTLHTYAAYSMMHGLNENYRWANDLFELAVGTFIGWLLHRAWGHFGHYGVAERFVRTVASFAVLAASGLAILVANAARVALSWEMDQPGPDAPRDLRQDLARQRRRRRRFHRAPRLESSRRHPLQRGLARRSSDGRSHHRM